MNKSEIYQFLEEKGIAYEKAEHPAVYNMAELAGISLPHPEAEAKNLFVRDDKKRNYYLITVKGDKRVDLKSFQEAYGTRRLSFASDDDLFSILGLLPGAVSPLGILNDDDKIVSFYVDKAFFCEPGLIGVHPNENTATVWLRPVDLISIIKEHGNPVTLVSFG
ncbi:MAG: prolyl-tRNA synthetase associated domain-containing protein [Anaerolineaceae bacterium]|nr:prolyl-tRNA synthetase associated domain-containing protein [Anaerolineaceae bacterium]